MVVETARRKSTRWLERRRFDVDAAVIGLLLAVAMVPLRFLSGDVYVETIPLVLGGACLVYLWASYRRQATTATATPTLPSSIVGALPTGVLLGVAFVILVATIQGGRSPLFYAGAAVSGALLLAQILFTPDEELDPRYVLGEVVLLALVVRLAALYTSASLIGIDVWTHHALAESILGARSLEAIAGNKHYVAPLYHLLVVSTSLLADVPPVDALSLSLGLAVPTSALLVFAATRFVVAARWALLASALYAMGDYVIEWGIHLIPTSMGLVFFLGVVYAAVRVMQTEYRSRDFLLLVSLTVAVVFTHQVSSFVMLVFLGAGVLAQYVLDRDLFRVSPLRNDVFRTMGPVNLLGLAVFDFGLLIFTWSFTPYRGDSFLETVGSFFVRTLLSNAGFLQLANPSSTPGGGGAEPTSVETLALYVDTTGVLLLLGATFIGCLYVLRRRRAKHSVYTLAFATAFMAIFVFGLPLFGIRNFIPQRWIAFMYVPMAVLSAIGVRFLSHRLSPRTFVVGLLAVSLVYPAAMVVSSNGAIDSPVFHGERARLSYTAPEVAAVETIGTMTGSPDPDDVPADEVLRTDHPYATVFTRTGAYPADVATIVDDGGSTTSDVTVYRTYQSSGASFFVNANERGQIRDVRERQVCRADQSTLYTNGQVELCVA